MSLHLLPEASPRKLRLLACACIRSMWCFVPHEIRAAVIEAEDLHPIVIDLSYEPQRIAIEDGSAAEIYAEGQSPFEWKQQPASVPLDDTPDGPDYAELVAEILTPCEFLPEWRTETVLALAQAMYDSKDFSTMPILADALQDAGCENEAILTHCRGEGPHVRGCWVTDAVLNKS